MRYEEAVRTIVINNESQILMVYATINNYYALPGGGIETNDKNHKAAAKREVEEETGYKVEIIKELYTYKEIKSVENGEKEIKESTCFLAKLIKKSEPKLIEEEIVQGLTSAWVGIDEAIENVEENLQRFSNTKYKTFFERDLNFLYKWKAYTESQSS